MIVSVLAFCFLILIGFSAYFGYKILTHRGTTVEDIDTERCSICRERFHKSQLILRQIGDYKLLHFCANCIEGLHLEAETKEN